MNTTLARRSAALLVWFLCLVPGRSGAAAPGDVYYTAHAVQKFKYYVFVDDVVEWTNATYSGTSLFQTAAHDTTTPLAYVNTTTSLQADSSLFQCDIGSEIAATAQRGIFHQAYNDLDLSVYIRAPSGTPFDITVDLTGTLLASREGGVDGSLQLVNGTSMAVFEDSNLTVANGGTESLALNSFDTISGSTTTEILVNNEVYSLAHTFILTSATSVTQALCILGCMREPADFHAVVSSHVRINVYPFGAPSAVPHTPRAQRPIALTASPNPWSGATRISFQAPPDTRTTIDVFDVRGRRVASLFDAPATGETQSLPWNASHLASGVYFLRAAAGRESSTRKLILLK